MPPPLHQGSRNRAADGLVHGKLCHSCAQATSPFGRGVGELPMLEVLVICDVKAYEIEGPPEADELVLR